MLNGLDPLIIINFKKLLPGIPTQGIPLLKNLGDSIPLAPIPIPLSERNLGITSRGNLGIYVRSHNKNVDFKTDVETNAEGESTKVYQTGLASSVTINMVSKKDSVALIVLSTMMDLIFPKCTSEEYSISYINGPMTVFGGLVESFSILGNDTNDLVDLVLVISKAPSSSTVAETASQESQAIDKVNGVDLNAGGVEA